MLRCSVLCVRACARTTNEMTIDDRKEKPVSTPGTERATHKRRDWTEVVVSVSRTNKEKKKKKKERIDEISVTVCTARSVSMFRLVRPGALVPDVCVCSIVWVCECKCRT